LKLASRTTAVNADDWEIQRNSGSAPGLYSAGERCELNASVAHSGLWVAAGLASGSRIGVDIQVQDERQRYGEMAELMHLDAIAAVDQQHFFSCWTLREAIAKATNGSVLTPHALESGLMAACDRPGQMVYAGPLSAMIDVIHPDVHLAIVLDGDTRMSLCA